MEPGEGSQGGLEMTETDEMTVMMQMQTGMSNVLKDSKDGMNVTRKDMGWRETSRIVGAEGIAF